MWACSCPIPPSRSPSWGMHCQLPVRHPADVLSLSLYKRTELGLGGKQGLSGLAEIGGKKVRGQSLAQAESGQEGRAGPGMQNWGKEGGRADLARAGEATAEG